MEYREEYKKIAEEKGYQYSDERTDITAFGSDNGNKVRTEFCLLEKEDCFYFAYDMYAPKAYLNNTYSGVYTFLNSVDDIECELIRKEKSFFNFIIYSSSNKTGDQYIDKNLYIKTNHSDLLKKHITHEIVDAYIKLWDSSPILPIKIIIGKGEDILPSIPAYKDKLIVGTQVNSWVEPTDLSETIQYFSEFIKLIK